MSQGSTLQTSDVRVLVEKHYGDGKPFEPPEVIDQGPLFLISTFLLTPKDSSIVRILILLWSGTVRGTWVVELTF